MSFSESWNIVVQYIIDHEKDDFLENPSDSHVYYHAIAAQFGEREAQFQLECAIASNEPGISGA